MLFVDVVDDEDEDEEDDDDEESSGGVAGNKPRCPFSLTLFTPLLVAFTANEVPPPATELTPPFNG